jgi:hypothetical protein
MVRTFCSLPWRSLWSKGSTQARAFTTQLQLGSPAKSVLIHSEMRPGAAERFENYFN